MFWLALLIPIVYIPNITGAAVATGWSAMSIGLPWLTWKEGAKVPSFFVELSLAFFIYVLFSLAWANNPDTGLMTVWQYGLIALAFLAGAQAPDLRQIARGVTIGLAISSAFAVAQVLGLSLIPEFVPCRPSGLLFNPIVLGSGCALAILLNLAYRDYLFAAVLLPGLLLSQSRAALLAAIVGCVALYIRPRQGLFTIAPLWLTCTFADTFSRTNADNMRWLVWRTLYHFLDFWGHGVGSLDSVLIVFQNHVYSPGYAHNEFLDLAYQYGIGAAPAAALLIAPLFQPDRREWPAYVGFFILTLCSFPLHAPVEAFLGAACAGSLSRSWGLARTVGFYSRFQPPLAPPLERASHHPVPI